MPSMVQQFTGKEPTVFNVDMAEKDTEYSQLLPKGAKKVLIKLRSGTALLKVSFVEGESGTNFITVPISSSKYLEGVYLKAGTEQAPTGKTLYFQSPTASQVAEIEVWV